MSARPAVFAAPVLPRKIGKYVVSHVIGEGAMGIVYKAVDPHIQRSVAIKTIRPPLLAAESAGTKVVERFRQEAQAAGRLNHPNIVSIYECGEYGDSGADLYIAMECVEGQSLLGLMRRGARLALADVTALMLQLLDALECAHQQRVWHCDIKPSNLLVTRDGRIKVTDFGIARIDSADFTRRTGVLGTPGYMAPERYTGEDPDQRVDIFSCGVLLYELLTGVAPFSGSSSAVMYQVLECEPPPPSALVATVPPGFDAVVARALAKRRDDRFANAAEMRQALLEADPLGTVPHALSPAAVADARGVPTQPRTGIEPLPSAASGSSTWDPRAIERIESLLRPRLGAVSAHAVRELARRSSSVTALVGKLAAGSFGHEEPAPPPQRAVAARPPAHLPANLPVLGDTPMRPDVVDAAGRVLAARIGPIALLLAKRAAKATSCREQFFCALADGAGADIDRKGLLDQLWQIH